MSDRFMGGYIGKILQVDLTNRKHEVNDLPECLVSGYIGGAGANAWLLFNSIYPGVDPLGPDNPLIFGAGPVVGLPFPTAARATITSVSPLTGAFGDSNGGGIAGVTMKRAGFDHIVIKGQSEQPCCLVIGKDSVCEIEDASELWGLDTEETISTLKKKFPKSVVLAIGQGGENLVRFAGIYANNGTNFSRSGMGAVMGAKKLKAIVAVGGKKPAVYDGPGLKAYSDKILNEIKNQGFPRLFKKYGTSMFLNIITARGLLYGENYRKRLPYRDIESLYVGEYLLKADSKPAACHQCPMACRRRWTIKEGKYAGEQGHGFDVAHLISFGCNLGLRDVTEILHLIRQSNLYGIDINELCGTLGMAIDAYQHGAIGPEETGGVELRFGDAGGIDKVLKAITYREGLGDALALGTKRAAERIGKGAEKYALHMKGMHWPAHSSPPFTLAFSVSTRGGDFLKGNPFLLLQSIDRKIISDLYGGTRKTMNIDSHADKGRSVWWHENHKLVFDNLGICFYLSMAVLQYRKLLFSGLSNLYSLATGIETSGEEMLIAGERGYQVERAVNTLLGLRALDDTFTRRPEPDSWARGIDLNKRGMLDEYYRYRGIGSNGITTGLRFKELGMDDIAGKLEKFLPMEEKTGDSYVSIHTIIKNPPETDTVTGFKNRINCFMQRKVMSTFEKDVSKFLKFFRKKAWK